jgi:hypothetical protein
MRAGRFASLELPQPVLHSNTSGLAGENETREMGVSSISTDRCPLCGELLGDDPNACPKCDWVRGYRAQASSRGQYAPRDVLAAALSVVPGAGHISKGYVLPGWLLMLIGVPVVCTFAFAFTMFFGWLLVPAYWLAVGTDAFLRKDLRPAKATQTKGP